MGKPADITDREVQSLCRKGENGRFRVGRNLWLEIKGGSKLFFFRWMQNGKSGVRSLGPYPAVSLSKAREKALEARRLVREGKDPSEERRANRAALSHTFAECASLFIKSRENGWRNPKHASQWEATLKQYVFPSIGQLPVSQITCDHILKILDPIWQTKSETASRVRGRMESIIAYAIARGWRPGDNPALWRGNLDKLLLAKNKLARPQHQPAVPWREIGAVMSALGHSGGLAAKCLQFVILTAARSGEARGAKWSEIDLEERLWTIPGSRMKAGREHRVPLSEPALDILRKMMALKHRPDSLVFPGGRPGSPLSDVALSKALRSAFSGSATVHGMRSTFRDWCAEQTDYPREIAEAALAHGNADKSEAAYCRTDYLDKRRALMGEWGAFLATP